jgi:hypothetical protein
LLAGARWLVEHLLGQSKFFDSVPVRYLFDVGDIAVTKFVGYFRWTAFAMLLAPIAFWIASRH